MEFIIGIIVFVLISLLSAAGKKKPQRSSDETYTRPTLSDIQRAFMMSGEMESPSAKAPRPEPAYSQPTPPEPATPVYEPDDYSVQTAQPVSASQASNRYAGINLASFHTDSAEDIVAPKKTVNKQKSSLKLFETKNDFVRAVIYSEILTRKAR